MRTKAEAMANPMAGDRWGMGENEFTIRKHKRGRVYYYNLWLLRNDSCPLAWFKTWAAGAEYLGNEANNA